MGTSNKIVYLTMSLAHRADPIEMQYSVSPDLDLHYMSISQHMLLVLIDIISVTYVRENLFSEVCKQQRHRPAWASAQSDQRLCNSLIGKYHI